MVVQLVELGTQTLGVGRSGLGADTHIDVRAAEGRVRVLAGGHTVIDSRRAVVLYEGNFQPVYYFPRDDVEMELLTR